MLILLSPSKTLDYDSPIPKVQPTQPAFLDQSEQMIAVLRKKSAAQLGTLMDISEKLATLNHQRYQDFTTPFTTKNARPCIFAFKGDVYDGLRIESFNAKALERAQQHLRILSGLYGLLRPMDLIQPYRLEMGTKLATKRGKDLYAFWGDRITEALNQELQKHKQKQIINLASQEYFAAVNVKKLQGELITPLFKEQKGNNFKVVALFAKKARGMMARYILQNNIKKWEDLTGFDEAGYSYESRMSQGAELVFARRAA